VGVALTDGGAATLRVGSGDGLNDAEVGEVDESCPDDEGGAGDPDLVGSGSAAVCSVQETAHARLRPATSSSGMTRGRRRASMRVSMRVIVADETATGPD
jgi:hypothetical protein